MNNETDQLNCTLSLDNEVAERLSPLAPHKSVFDLNSPREVSTNLSIPKTVVGTLSQWIHSVEYIDPVKLSKMEQLYCD